MTEKFAFSKARLNKLTPPPEGRWYFYDTKVNGLGLSVTKAGAKSFLVYRKLDGEPLRVTLGRYPDMKIEQARKLAQKELAEIAGGRNPIKAKRAARLKGLTVSQVLDDYKAKRKKTLRPNTVADYTNAIDNHLSDWKDKPLGAITRDMIGKRHAKLSEASPAVANKTMRVLRALFNFANGQYEDELGASLYPENPIKRLTHNKAWNPITPRTGYIRPSQLESWFKATLALSGSERALDQVVGDYFMFVVLTGLRRREAAALKVIDVNFEERSFTIRQTKNGKELALPYSDFVEQILVRRRDATNGEYLFPSEEGRPINDPRRQLEALRAASGHHFTTHDLRRTFITIAESLDIPVFALKRLVNHSVGTDVTQGYVIWDVERLRKPIQAITDFILKAALVKPSNVESISAAAK
jgi:integrase